MIHPAVAIYWRDAVSHSSDDYTEEQVKVLGYLPAVTRGHLMEESRYTFKVAQTVWTDEGEFLCARHLFVIPKVSVERVILLNEGEELYKNANL